MKPVTRPLGLSAYLCVGCGNVQPAAQFRLLKGRYVSSWCTSCAVAGTRKWRLRNHGDLLERNRARYVHVEHQERVCACGTPFVEQLSTQRHCSDACAKTANHRHEKKRIQRKRLRIFERDEWTCALCGEPIDPDLQVPNGRAGTIDHAIPKSVWRLVVGSSLGLDHDANWQAMHFDCNVKKHVQAVVTRRMHNALFAHLNATVNRASQIGPVPARQAFDLTVVG